MRYASATTVSVHRPVPTTNLSPIVGGQVNGVAAMEISDLRPLTPFPQGGVGLCVGVAQATGLVFPLRRDTHAANCGLLDSLGPIRP